MKATLEFSLPDEGTELDRALKAGDMQLVITEMDNYLRNKIKYAPETMSDVEREAYQSVRDRLTELCNEYDVRFE